jgi:peroxisomal 2,4-dienoyl-CoA reductase
MSTYSPTLLSGKVAVVTGGGSGIGKGIAEAFLLHSCTVIIIGRSKERLEQAQKELENKVRDGAECAIYPCDVRDYKSLSVVFDQIVSRFSKIDILVNGAAGNFLAPIKSLSSTAFKNILDIDTNGTFNTSKLAYHTSMQKNGGVIINLSAYLQRLGTILQTHAGSAKAAIDAMTRHMAVEWGHENIRVNSIAIGPIEATEGMKKLKLRAPIEQNNYIPLQRYGTAMDIANTCLFLASDAASYITGTSFDVDGGSQYTSAYSSYSLGRQNLDNFPSKL